MCVTYVGTELRLASLGERVWLPGNRKAPQDQSPKEPILGSGLLEDSMP